MIYLEELNELFVSTNVNVDLKVNVSQYIIDVVIDRENSLSILNQKLSLLWFLFVVERFLMWMIKHVLFDSIKLCKFEMIIKAFNKLMSRVINFHVFQVLTHKVFEFIWKC